MNHRCASAFNCRGAIFYALCRNQESGKMRIRGTLQKDSQKFGFIEIKPYLCSMKSL